MHIFSILLLPILSRLIQAHTLSLTPLSFSVSAIYTAEFVLTAVLRQMIDFTSSYYVRVQQ